MCTAGTKNWEHNIRLAKQMLISLVTDPLERRGRESKVEQTSAQSRRTFKNLQNSDSVTIKEKKVRITFETMPHSVLFILVRARSSANTCLIQGRGCDRSGK